MFKIVFLIFLALKILIWSHSCTHCVKKLKPQAGQVLITHSNYFLLNTLYNCMTEFTADNQIIAEYLNYVDGAFW